MYTKGVHTTTLAPMSVPVTCRLAEEDVAKLDEAVDLGLGRSRSALVAAAVAEWLERHDEETIAESYRRAYAEPDPEHDELMRKISIASFTAIVVKEAGDAPG